MRTLDGHCRTARTRGAAGTKRCRGEWSSTSALSVPSIMRPNHGQVLRRMGMMRGRIACDRQMNVVRPHGCCEIINDRGVRESRVREYLREIGPHGVRDLAGGSARNFFQRRATGSDCFLRIESPTLQSPVEQLSGICTPMRYAGLRNWCLSGRKISPRSALKPIDNRVHTEGKP